MAITLTWNLTNGTTPDADQVMRNLDDIVDYINDGHIVEANLTDKYYRQVLTFTAAAPADGVAFDFGMVKFPPVSQYAITEALSIGVEAITGASIIANVEINGSAISGTATATAAGTPVPAALAATTLASGASLKVAITGAFTGVKNLTVCVFLRQIIKGA